MDVRLFSWLSLGFAVLNFREGDAVTPRVTLSHWAPWRDLSEEDPGMLVADRFRYALKKTLDVIWIMKCRALDAEFNNELSEAKEGQPIANLTQLISDLRAYLTHLAWGVAKMHISRVLNPWERADPLNSTIFSKLMNDWMEIREVATQYKPKEAKFELEKICKAANDALFDLPVRYKPIRALVKKVQNETYISARTRKELAGRGEAIIRLSSFITITLMSTLYDVSPGIDRIT